MIGPLPDITLIIIVGTLLFLSLAAFVIVLLFLYKQKYLAHQAELISLREAHQREILQAQLETQNQTLQHVADELHDHLGQMVSVVLLHLNLLRDETAGTPHHNKVAQLLTHTGSIMTDLRSLSKSLSTDTIARFGLVECIRLELERIDRADQPERTQLTVVGEPCSLGQETETILLRMVQEALNNAIKHAHNAPIALSLQYEPNALTITIADKGPGFSLAVVEAKATTKAGQGLHNLRRRASLLGGSCVWHTAPGEGTRVMLTIPRNAISH